MFELKEIEENLWNDPASTFAGQDKYADHMLEQYRLCLTMADKISDRRSLANSFFLTFHTALVGALALVYSQSGGAEPPAYAAAAFFLGAIVFCVAWGLLLRSYRNLNTAKFKVIGAMEKRLPTSPFYAAEWKALKEGKDWRVYIPLSPIETFVPMGFGLVYVFLFVMQLV